MDLRRVVIYEPICKDIEHVPVNMALIETISLIYPEARLSFWAEKCHCNCIKESYKKKGIFFYHLRYKHLRTKIAAFLNVGSLFLRTNKHDVLIFSSISAFHLRLVKFYSLIFKRKGFLIFHSMLEELRLATSARFLNILLNNHPKQFKYVVLSAMVERNIASNFRTLSDKIISIEHPLLIDIHTPDTQVVLKNSSRLTFGSIGFGSAKKGTSDFFWLAKETCERSKCTKFVYLGKVDLTVETNDHVKILGRDRPLSRNHIEEAMKDVNFLIFMYPPDSYQYTVSGAFFDALIYLKPIIVLRNAFFEYMFSLLGNIGFICDSRDDMGLLLNKLANDGIPSIDMQEMIDNLKNARLRFAPESIVKNILKENTWNQ